MAACVFGIFLPGRHHNLFLAPSEVFDLLVGIGLVLVFVNLFFRDHLLDLFDLHLLFDIEFVEFVFRKTGGC